MPNTTQAQQAKVDDIKTKTAAAKVAIGALISSVDSLRGDAAAANTLDGATAADELLIYKGELQKALGTINAAHGAASKALLAYDPTLGIGIVAQGGTNR